MWWPVVVVGEASLTISIYVGLLFLFLRVPLLSWSGLNLVFVSICLCFSAVSSHLAVSGILLDSGVPMVLLARSVMVVWFYRSSFIVLAVLVFSFLL